MPVSEVVTASALTTAAIAVVDGYVCHLDLVVLRPAVRLPCPAVGHHSCALAAVAFVPSASGLHIARVPRHGTAVGLIDLAAAFRQHLLERHTPGARWHRANTGRARVSVDRLRHCPAPET